MIYTITHSKIRFEYLCPKPSDINIEDIAHSLSHICRFTGHTKFHASVAQHSLILSRLVSPENALWALLHDGAECYLNDLSSPLKKVINGNYNFLHDLFLERICEKFHLPKEEPEEVRRMDRILTVNELWQLIDDSYEEEGIPRLDITIEQIDPPEAKLRFLERFIELYDQHITK
jgi:5'-deoxynucleotidase YfbR-like HD superfamily hydrolase